MTPGDARMFRRRTAVLALLFGVGFSLVLARAFQLQIIDFARYDRLARSEYLREVRVPARRGDILDRHGKPLAVSVDVPSIHANPALVLDAKRAASALAGVLHMRASTLQKRLSSERQFVWLKRRTTPAVAQRVAALGLPGIFITSEPKRYYPNKEAAAHVLGFTSIDSEGLEGIERSLDEVLRGEPQVIPTVRDARGRAVLHDVLDPSGQSVGARVFLTLDLQIQHAAQQALKTAVTKHRAKAGVAIVLDVGNGDVLAMAVEPTFNPNAVGRVDSAARRNRGITDMFEPGSTFKPLVVAAALDAGVISPRDAVFCENGTMRIGRHSIRDTKPHAYLSLSKIIAQSSNIGAAKIGQALGRQRLHGALQGFGFGRKIGVAFPGEAAGSLRAAQTWSDVGVATIAFGHGVAVTPLQLAAAYRVLAAGGEYVAPRLVMRVETQSGGPLQQPTRARRQVISQPSAARVTAMMEQVVSADGTGLRAAVPGYRVAGKTGTAQKLDLVSGGYSSDHFIASFAGFIPAQAPRVVILVAVDDPQGEVHTGGGVAAPVFSEIALASMQQLGVGATEHDAAKPWVSDQSEAEAKPAVAVGSPVQPTPGQVPSFLGMTARQAIERYASLDLDAQLDVRGKGLVVRQRPAPGSALDKTQHLALVLEDR